VYITVTQFDGVEWPSITNVGVRPTVDGRKESVETHILGFPNEPLYGKRLRVGFVKKIRDEIKFDNLELLVQQISRDVEQAYDYFK
jgi:riboflavin kinase/FMN adenylyltransferase